MIIMCEHFQITLDQLIREDLDSNNFEPKNFPLPPIIPYSERKKNNNATDEQQKDIEHRLAMLIKESSHKSELINELREVISNLRNQNASLLKIMGQKEQST